LKKIDEIYGDFLKSINLFDNVISLGPGTGKKPAKDPEILKDKTSILTGELKKRFKFNDKIIILAIILLSVLFLVGVSLVFYYRGSPSVMGSVLGGTFFSLLSIVRWLYKLWREKSIMDISLTIIDALPPEKAAEFINTIFWKLRSEAIN
jgi:hypothetical protein